jgi:hypothetical protein
VVVAQELLVKTRKQVQMVMVVVELCLLSQE